MVVRSLGAGSYVDSQGKWPENYMSFAREKNLIKGINRSQKAEATRLEASIIISNALEANMYENNKAAVGKTILKDTLGITKFTNLKFKNINIKDRKVTTYEGNTYAVADRANLAILKANFAYDIWYDNKNKEITGFIMSESFKGKVESFTEIKDIDLVSKKVTFVVDGKDKQYEYTTNGVLSSLETETDAVDTEVNLNGMKGDFDDESIYRSLEPLKANTFGKIVVEDGKISNMYVEFYTSQGIISRFSNSNMYLKLSTIGTKGATTINLAEVNTEFYILKNGQEIKVSELEKGDALYYYLARENNIKKYYILVNNNIVTGEFKLSKSDDQSVNYIEINGEKYESEVEFNKELLLGEKLSSDGKLVNSKVKAYLNIKGKVAMYSYEIPDVPNVLYR